MKGFVQYCKDQGVEHIRFAGIDLAFRAPEALTQPAPEFISDELIKANASHMPSDRELLFASSEPLGLVDENGKEISHDS